MLKNKSFKKEKFLCDYCLFLNKKKEAKLRDDNRLLCKKHYKKVTKGRHNMGKLKI